MEPDSTKMLVNGSIALQESIKNNGGLKMPKAFFVVFQSS